jgi:hypothetical protein
MVVAFFRASAMKVILPHGTSSSTLDKALPFPPWVAEPVDEAAVSSLTDKRFALCWPAGLYEQKTRRTVRLGFAEAELYRLRTQHVCGIRTPRLPASV